MTMWDQSPHSLDLDTVPHLQAYSKPDTNIDIEAKMFEMFFLIVMCSHPSVNLAGVLRESNFKRRCDSGQTI